MDKRTEEEKNCHETFLKLRDEIAHPHSPHSFMDMVAMIRDRIKSLENKQFGCISGRHAGACECK